MTSSMKKPRSLYYYYYYYIGCTRMASKDYVMLTDWMKSHLYDSLWCCQAESSFSDVAWHPLYWAIHYTSWNLLDGYSYKYHSATSGMQIFQAYTRIVLHVFIFNPQNTQLLFLFKDIGQLKNIYINLSFSSPVYCYCIDIFFIVICLCLYNLLFPFFSLFCHLLCIYIFGVYPNIYPFFL